MAGKSLGLASGPRSHSLVEPSTSVNRNVIVPVGSPVIDFGPDPPGAHFPTRKIIAHPASHSEIMSGKATGPYGHLNIWRLPSVTQAHLCREADPLAAYVYLYALAFPSSGKESE